MPSAKQDAADLIASMPDDTSLEEIQERLYVLEKIRAGQEALEAGGAVSHDAAKARLARWVEN